MENRSKLSRRAFLRGAALVGAGAALAACAPRPLPRPPASRACQARCAGRPRRANRRPRRPRSASSPTTAKPMSRSSRRCSRTSRPRIPNIEVEYLDIAGNEFYNSINTQGAGGQLPDVWYTRTFDVPVYASKDWTISLAAACRPRCQGSQCR